MGLISLTQSLLKIRGSKSIWGQWQLYSFFLSQFFSASKIKREGKSIFYTKLCLLDNLKTENVEAADNCDRKKNHQSQHTVSPAKASWEKLWDRWKTEASERIWEWFGAVTRKIESTLSLKVLERTVTDPLAGTTGVQSQCDFKG